MPCGTWRASPWPHPVFARRYDAIAPHWTKNAADVAGLEATKLYDTLKRVHEASVHVKPMSKPMHRHII